MMAFFYGLNKVFPDWRAMVEEVGRRAPGDGDGLRVDARLYLILLNIFVYPILLPLSLIFGTELVASDLRTNALESYFSRPITPLGYLLGRTLAYTGFLLSATLLPLLIVWYSDVSTAPSGHFDVVGRVPIGLALALVPITLTITLLVQAAATVTRSAMGANIFMVVFFVFLHVLGISLAETADDRGFLAISFLSVMESICRFSLGVPVGAQDDFIAPTGPAYAVMTGLAVFSFMILWRQLRRRVLVG
jgi:hypothetical protein